jgi:predicted ATPase
MGEFLAAAAAAGVQVILETHSDHVLNGIRRSVKARVLAPNQVALHFFQPRDGEGAQVISPLLDASGNLDIWPDGFFDQFDKDANHFAGWGD